VLLTALFRFLVLLHLLQLHRGRLLELLLRLLTLYQQLPQQLAS